MNEEINKLNLIMKHLNTVWGTGALMHAVYYPSIASASMDKHGKYIGWVILEKEYYFRPVLTSKKTYDTEEIAKQEMEKLLEQGKAAFSHKLKSNELIAHVLCNCTHFADQYHWNKHRRLVGSEILGDIQDPPPEVVRMQKEFFDKVRHKWEARQLKKINRKIGKM